MGSMYEPEIPGDQLKGDISIAVKEVVGPNTQNPTKVIKNSSPWTIDVTLKTEGKLARTNPFPDANSQWVVKAYLESFTGNGPERQVGSTETINLKSDRVDGTNAAGFGTAEWHGTIDVPATDNPTSEYEVCRVTVVAITADNATGTPIPGAHFATVDDLVAIYRP